MCFLGSNRSDGKFLWQVGCDITEEIQLVYQCWCWEQNNVTGCWRHPATLLKTRGLLKCSSSQLIYLRNHSNNSSGLSICCCAIHIVHAMYALETFFFLKKNVYDKHTSTYQINCTCKYQVRMLCRLTHTVHVIIWAHINKCIQAYYKLYSILYMYTETHHVHFKHCTSYILLYVYTNKIINKQNILHANNIYIYICTYKNIASILS